MVATSGGIDTSVSVSIVTHRYLSDGGPRGDVRESVFGLCHTSSFAPADRSARIPTAAGVSRLLKARLRMRDY